MPGGGSLALSEKGISNLLKHWLDTMGDGSGAIGTGDEVGEAGHDDDGGLGPDLSESLLEDPDVTARKDLGLLQLGIGSATCLRDVGSDIRIPKKGKDSNLGRHPRCKVTTAFRNQEEEERRLGSFIVSSFHCVVMLNRLKVKIHNCVYQYSNNRLA